MDVEFSRSVVAACACTRATQRDGSICLESCDVVCELCAPLLHLARHIAQKTQRTHSVARCRQQIVLLHDTRTAKDFCRHSVAQRGLTCLPSSPRSSRPECSNGRLPIRLHNPVDVALLTAPMSSAVTLSHRWQASLASFRGGVPGNR